LRASTHPETKTADLRDDLRVLFDVAPHRSIGESRRVASKVLDMSAGTMSSAGRLRLFAAVLLVLNVLATAGAVVVNLPAQFGGVGTDAGDEFLTRGTAISAPLLPVVLLCIVVALSGRRDGWGWIGIAAAYATAITVGIGGWGGAIGRAHQRYSRRGSPDVRPDVVGDRCCSGCLGDRCGESTPFVVRAGVITLAPTVGHSGRR
jgi:hypothetical protein